MKSSSFTIGLACLSIVKISTQEALLKTIAYKAINRLQDTDITNDSQAKLDASGMFDSFVQKLGMNRNMYIEAFVKAAHKANRLEQIFSKQLINAISPPKPELEQQKTRDLKVVE